MQVVSTVTSALPPSLPGLAGGSFTAYQILATAVSYRGETNAESRVQYSKFATNANQKSGSSTETIGPTWPSQLGMLVIYTPALIASVVLLKLGTLPADQLAFLPFSIPPPTPAAVLCAFHFCKRVCEVLVVHKYSGRVDRKTPSLVGFYYSVVAVLVAFVSDPNPSPKALQVGKLLFGIGLSGNFYHHRLLAKLRSSGDSTAAGRAEKKYVPPRGGLFRYVAAPHYLFELVGWLGVAVVSHHLNVYLVFTAMCSYLAGRSVAQNEFNRKKFTNDEWPETRKNLIPFIF